MGTPYDDLPNDRFWRRGVAAVEPHALDPVGRPKFRISAEDKVATAGSCFAQHIARSLGPAGLTHHIVEGAPSDLSAAEAEARQYGVYSARYGNIYTARQLLEVLQEAFGERPVDAEAWPHRSAPGRFVDPFRPSVDPEGLESPEAVRAARAAHLAAVRRMVETTDVFVFTLGLTEAWRRKSDGRTYPVAPGALGGVYDPEAHEFVNYSAAEVAEDMREAVRRLRRHRKGIRVILTVSPVPLIATYEPRHVLVSTVYSKSVLRVAAEETVNQFNKIAYFPSYEIVTGPHTAGAYFDEDRRSVTPAGVAHAMRAFLGSFGRGAAGAAKAEAKGATDASAKATVAAQPLQGYEGGGDEMICDEEALDPTARAKPL